MLAAGWPGTYASFLLMLGASAVVGQAVFAACGRRTWSRLSPAVGLAALLAISWATVRLPGQGTAAIVALGVLTAVAALRPRGGSTTCPGRCGRGPGRARRARGRLAAVHRRDALRDPRHRAQPGHVAAPVRRRPARATAAAERLISSGYPLGPHSLVVAVSALGAEHRARLRRPHSSRSPSRPAWPRSACSNGSSPSRRIVGALLVGFAYLLAAYFTQGSLQGDDRGAVRCSPSRSGSASWRVSGDGARAGRASRPRAAAGGARDRRGLRLQLSRARLARLARSGSGCGRARSRRWRGAASAASP